MSKDNSKAFVFYGILIFIGLVFIIKLVQLQLTSDYYLIQAERNGSTEITLYPVRGAIYDRNGKLIVYNDVVYDLSLVPMKAKDFDTMSLCKILKIDKEEYIERMLKASKYSRRKISLFYKHLDTRTYSIIQENLQHFPGFIIEHKTDRKYKFNGLSHVLGYVSEVSERTVNENSYYKPGDLIGETGVEKSYEEFLRGKKGVRVVLRDRFNLEKGSFADGMYDTMPIAGEDLYLSIDLDLQEMAEKFLENKKGSIVAIDPKTGEVLCLANSPAYDPNMLTGAERNSNFPKLLRDPIKPLYNRALKAPYPPGSTFKTVQSLIGRQEQVVFPDTRYSCFGGYRMGGRTVGCHGHANPVNLQYSIHTSCNGYYCHIFRLIVDNPKYKNISEGLDAWVRYLNSFGIGQLTGIDIPGESKGILPSPALYEKIFGKNWKSSNIISIAIGQGEVGMTPLQLANMCATIANKGYYITPHVVKGIGNEKTAPSVASEINYTMVDSMYFEFLINSMNLVYKPGGTAWWTAIPGIELCGKTGTAQNPHGKDHSVFIGFGPREDPKIAVAILIENGGFGATWAAPMTSLIMERYITGSDKTSKPDMYKRMLNPVIPPTVK